MELRAKLNHLMHRVKGLFAGPESYPQWFVFHEFLTAIAAGDEERAARIEPYLSPTPEDPDPAIIEEAKVLLEISEDDLPTDDALDAQPDNPDEGDDDIDPDMLVEVVR